MSNLEKIDEKINEGGELTEGELEALTEFFVETWDNLADPNITFKIEIEKCTSNSQMPSNEE